jgi:hypothetical protein
MIVNGYKIAPGASLHGADLAHSNVVDLGTNPRGYHFIAVPHPDTWTIAKEENLPPLKP